MITQKELKKRLLYKGGNLIWAKRTANCVQVGDIAGCLGAKGYWFVGINGKQYPAHRLVFLYHHNYLPKFIDHIDGNPLNNSIKNLRECTNQENQYNSKTPKHNTSGVKGVSWIKRKGMYCVRFKVNGKAVFFGYFNDLSEAAAVARDKRTELHGEFANNG